ncbi:MAG: 16S rRNA (guanine(966)-N(2))-methyltransferase RsmD [Alphaproteobacteria bacterium]|nr:16S rRNA (guanine(966)-N(2))-methyltransferase RsmD [Alphaproteobacteria bacterium]|tara:strand:+ start:264933 stop:265496 length:564 start_codon:yes stop_codon:yes gene_type:complete
MRITGGTYGGRKLNAPSGKDIRPTSDRLRLAVFNMLESRMDLEGCHVADMFCGTGALGIEALSRGASFARFFDQDRRSLALTKDNLNALSIPSSSYSAVLGSALKIPPRGGAEVPLNVVFLDPPYHKDLVAPCIANLIDGVWLADGALLVVETEKGGLPNISAWPQTESLREKAYGDTELALYIYNA